MAAALLDRICNAYLESPDFNGFLFAGTHVDERRDAINLVRTGSVEVVSEEDFLNPSIRPWPSRRGVEAQVASIESLSDGRSALCLYPNPSVLRDRVTALYPDRPYQQRMAEGRGTLELAYFEFPVLEQYRNDPRFHFRFDDFGADALIGDAAYLDESEPAYDKIIMGHIGFAYDLSRYEPADPDTPIVRRVCAFYGDLAKLSARHQQRWQTYQLEDEAQLHPHPVWWGEQMGHWADGLGPFDRLFMELEALSTLYERAYGEALVRVTERPDGFGWILRATQHEWDNFVQQLDKVLSENIQHRALTAAGVPRKDETDQVLGTLRRLEMLLLDKRITAEAVDRVLQPLKDVRAARQAPAHALRTNVTDTTFVRRQVNLLEQVNFSIENLRRLFQTHPANRGWSEPDYLNKDAAQYRF
jgi:hypothetical protein